MDDDGQFELPLKRNDAVLCIAWNLISTIEIKLVDVWHAPECWGSFTSSLYWLIRERFKIQKRKKNILTFFNHNVKCSIVNCNTIPRPVDKWFGCIFVAGETVSTKLIQFQLRIFLFFFSFSMPPDCRLTTTAGLCEKQFISRVSTIRREQEKTASIGLNCRETVIKIHSKICHFSHFIISAFVDEWVAGWSYLSHLLDFIMERRRNSQHKRCEQSLETCSRGERQEARGLTMYIVHATLYRIFTFKRCKRWILIFISPQIPFHVVNNAILNWK